MRTRTRKHDWKHIEMGRLKETEAWCLVLCLPPCHWEWWWVLLVNLFDIVRVWLFLSQTAETHFRIFTLSGLLCTFHEKQGTTSSAMHNLNPTPWSSENNTQYSLTHLVLPIITHRMAWYLLLTAEITCQSSPLDVLLASALLSSQQLKVKVKAGCSALLVSFEDAARSPDEDEG